MSQQNMKCRVSELGTRTVRTDPRMFWNVLEFEYFI